MANIVGDIAIQVGADIAPLVTNLGRGVGAVKTFGAAADTAASGPMRRMAAVAGTIAGTATAAAIGLAAMTKAAIDNIGALNDAAKATGLQVAQLQAMRQVAEEASVSGEALTKSLIKMQDTIANAANGSKAQADAITGIGLSIQGLAATTPDEQFAQLALAIDSIGDPTRRAEAAINIFGKSGADLIPMMTGYRDAVKDAAEYQAQFGIAISDTDAGKIDTIGDSMGRLAGTASGVGTQLAIAFAPEIQFWIDAIAESMRKTAEFAIMLNEAITTTDTEQALVDIAGASSDMVASISQAAIGLQGLADGEITQALRGHAQSIQNATHDLQDGKLSASEYRDILIGAAQGVIAVYQEVETLDGTDMSGAIEAMNDYAKAIGGPLDRLLALIGLQAEAAATALPQTGGLVLGAQGFGGRPEGLEGTNGGAVGFARNRIAANIASSADSGGGGGGGGDNGLQALRDSLKTEADAVNAAYEEKLQKLKDFRDQKLLTEEEYNALELRAQEEHAEALRGIDAYRYGSGLDQAGQFFGDMANAMQSGNDKMVKTARVFGAAEALINTWRAYTQTIADPKLPFLAKFAAGASVLAAGMNAVNAIKGAGSGGGGGGSAGASAASASSAQTPLQVSLSGFSSTDLFTGGMISDLFTKLRAEAGDRGVQFV